MKHKVVSHEEWTQARKALLVREKEFARQREALARDRRELPWEEVTEHYEFDGEDGTTTLLELFRDHTQLVVYHFMFPPEWDAGCPHCSFWADSFNGTLAHLNARDVAFAVISRAPLAKITAYRQRMGWTFPWYSSGGSRFNYDFGASFTPEQIGTPAYNYGSDPSFTDREGIGVFARENGAIFHTYSTYARGIDPVNGVYQFLDLVPEGRNEDPADTQSWVRRHDEY